MSPFGFGTTPDWFVAGELTTGRLLIGHNGSSATNGSVRGMHIGKPVSARMVGLSWSTWKRSSGVWASP